MGSSVLGTLAFRNGVRARNRVALAALTNQQSHDDGTLSDVELRWLLRRAEGGFGMTTTCAAYVARDGRAWPGELGIDDDAKLPGLARLGGALRAAGTLGVVQIFHGGVRAPSATTGAQPWSASSWDEDTPDFERPREATEADLARVIGQFRDAAVRAEAAGFAGVEVHAAHGYLPSQFLSATMNRRTDAWGGALPGRARLLRGIVQAARAAVKPSFLVGVRLSPEDFGFARGLDVDESLQVARWCRDDGADFVHVSLWDWTRKTTKRPDEHAIPLFREAVGPSVALLAAGKIWTRDDAEAVLDLGADMVALGRCAIVNPSWPLQVEDPAWAPRRPPLTLAELGERDVSPGFAHYLRRWKGFVADDAAPVPA